MECHTVYLYHCAVDSNASLVAWPYSKHYQKTIYYSMTQFYSWYLCGILLSRAVISKCFYYTAVSGKYSLNMYPKYMYMYIYIFLQQYIRYIKNVKIRNFKRVKIKRGFLIFSSNIPLWRPFLYRAYFVTKKTFEHYGMLTMYVNASFWTRGR